MSFVKLYTAYRDIPIIVPTTPTDERAYIVRLQQQRDSDFLNKLMYENIPLFPMEIHKFNEIKHKLIKLSSYEERLCLLLVYPEKVLGISYGEEMNFTDIKDAFTHYCNIDKNKNIKHFPVKVY